MSPSREAPLLHRCRLVEWTPAAVAAIAPSADGRAVAVGREDGEVELYNVLEDWHCAVRVPGEEGAALTALLWCAASWDEEGGAPAAALVSAGLNGYLVEYDLLNARPRSRTSSLGGPVWSLAAQPAQPAQPDAAQARPCPPCVRAVSRCPASDALAHRPAAGGCLR